ncbi:4Fe-4S binding protein [Rhodovastum atsumiense]|uniref:4Fe-4S binding protein n=2 Tax=Rhodovastum atsumiense TaxID=504468 RepID=A0A5M6IIT6_9PROT|nr:4Fe-4S binding protein [Rhodovastum atsumiense]
MLARPPGRVALHQALARFGDWLARNRHRIRILQWGVVGCYVVLVAVPAFLPLPPRTAHVWNDLTLFAQFAFWGIWWPFVLLSMVLVGRSWCGLFCPEGALSEFASRRSLGRAVPRWITWRGWPFVAFVATTVYGQMVSVYQYPAPVLVVLGGSTLAAIAVGLVYGRNKRVWCRYLCPVNGVFDLLARLAPVHFRVDPVAWQASQRRREIPPPVNCAPLVPIRTMTSAGGCHMCGRCSGFRDAITLAARSPAHEVVHVAGSRANPWETALILFGLMGVAVGAFHWSSSPWFIAAKQFAADWLVEAGVLWPLERSAPWWLLTDYPAQNDVLSLLDGAMLLAYVGATALAWGLSLAALLAAGVRLAGPWSWGRFHHLAQTLIPMAGCGVFLGLSATTITLLHAEGVSVPGLAVIRALLLAGALAWSSWLAWRVGGTWPVANRIHRAATTGCVALAAGFSAFAWVLLFWVW